MSTPISREYITTLVDEQSGDAPGSYVYSNKRDAIRRCRHLVRGNVPSRAEVRTADGQLIYQCHGTGTGVEVEEL